MTKKEFLRISAILGVGLPMNASLFSCNNDDNSNLDFSGKVIIIGAGAGGLSAGYLLQQLGIEFEILEASGNYGGRMRVNTNFADFPIALGAEWLESNVDVLREIVNNSSISINVETISDKPDRKFVNSSWFNFFEEYIVPSIADRIRYNTVVKSVDYSGSEVLIRTLTAQYTSNKVIVSVPLKILKDGDIEFIPALPQVKQEAINDSIIWDGFKAFFEFSNKFYDDEYKFDIIPSADGEKIYYNASFGQNTTKHIVGLFVVGRPAEEYISLSGDNLRDAILNELDTIYSNQATPNYIKHITQNWNNEPYIKSGYLTDNADWRTVEQLGKSVANKIYFAGGAYTEGNNWVSVHVAAQSAKKSIEEIVN